MHPWAAILACGALLSGIGSILSGLAALRQARKEVKVQVKTEVEPTKPQLTIAKGEVEEA